MTLRKVIKKNAKASLKNNWGRALLILLIFIGVNMLLNMLDGAIFRALGYENIRLTYDFFSAPSFQYEISEIQRIPAGAYGVSFLFTLIRICLIAPLMLGVNNWALELTDGRKKPVGSIFWAFDNAAFGRSIWLDITITVKVTLFSWLVMLIPALMLGFGTARVLSEAVSVILIGVGSLLLLACVPFVFWFSSRYFMAPVLLCDRYYYTVREATRLSVEASKGHRWEIVGFYFSFLPWFLFCCLIIPILYVIPYFEVSTVMYARFLFEDHLMKQSKPNLSDPANLIVDDLTPEAYQEARREQGVPQETQGAEVQEAPTPAETAPHLDPQPDPQPETAPDPDESFYYPRTEQSPPAPQEDPQDGEIADL